jgi:hypothetical protein
MTTGSVRTQGSELYVLNTIPATDVVLKFFAPTGISGLGGAADQIDDSDLDNTVDRTFKRGLGNPGQVTVPFNFVPTDASHQTVLFDMKTAGDVYQWMAGLSDGTDPPTIVSDVLTPPTTRSSLKFDGYVADVNIDIATNEIVRGTLIIQRSGVVTLTPKA